MQGSSSELRIAAPRKLPSPSSRRVALISISIIGSGIPQSFNSTMKPLRRSQSLLRIQISPFPFFVVISSPDSTSGDMFSSMNPEESTRLFGVRGSRTTSFVSCRVTRIAHALIDFGQQIVITDPPTDRALPNSNSAYA